MNYEAAGLPVYTLNDGRRFIPDSALTECPWVFETIGGWNNQWRYDLAMRGYVGPPRSVMKRRRSFLNALRRSAVIIAGPAPQSPSPLIVQEIPNGTAQG